MPAFLYYALWILAALAALSILLVGTAVALGQYLLCRSLRIAAARLCPKCGNPIGRGAVVAEWEIECPQCGLRFYFYPGKNRIETASVLAPPSDS